MKAILEILKFDVEDIITASGGFVEGDSESGSGSGKPSLQSMVDINR